MDARLQEVLLDEVRAQIEAAAFAAATLDRELEGLRGSLRMTEADMRAAEAGKQRVWFYVDSTLTALTHVANLLWPSPGAQDPDALPRGEALREVLGLKADDSLGIRNVRNGFEHFDERLDKWGRTSNRQNLVDRFIGPRTTWKTVPDGDVARLFDPDSGEVIVFGKGCNLTDAMEELKQLYALLPEQ